MDFLIEMESEMQEPRNQATVVKLSYNLTDRVGV